MTVNLKMNLGDIEIRQPQSAATAVYGKDSRSEHVSYSPFAPIAVEPMTLQPTTLSKLGNDTTAARA